MSFFKILLLMLMSNLLTFNVALAKFEERVLPPQFSVLMVQGLNFENECGCKNSEEVQQVAEEALYMQKFLEAIKEDNGNSKSGRSSN